LDIIMGKIGNWPEWGTEILTKENQLRVGGPVVNSAAVMVADGFDVEIVSAVGDDFMGEIIFDTFDKLGINTSKINVIKGQTPFSVGIKHTEGERSFFTSEGIMNNIDIYKHLKYLLDLKNSHILINSVNLIPGFQAPEMDKFLSEIDSSNKVYLDSGWPVGGWTPQYRSHISKLIQKSQWFLPNETEIVNLMNTENLREALRKYKELFTTPIVVKCGKKGAVIYENGYMTEVGTEKSDSVKDTIGAGDSFNAAFIMKKYAGCKSEYCAEYSNEKAKKWVEGYFSDKIHLA